jgi:Transposase DDE domain
VGVAPYAVRAAGSETGASDWYLRCSSFRYDFDFAVRNRKQGSSNNEGIVSKLAVDGDAELSATRIFSQWPVREGTEWTPQRLAWINLLMAWSDGQTLSSRFQFVSNTAQDWHPHWKLGRSYSGFAQASVSKSPKILEALKRRFRAQMTAETQTFRDPKGFCVLAVDGSRLECPHTAANEEGLGCAGREKTGPQVFVTTLWHPGFALPWDFRSGPGTDSERRHLDQMLEDLPEKTLLLSDAGFVSYELCQALLHRGHSFLLRVGSNVHLLTDLEYDYEQRDDIVYLWPTKRRHCAPLKLRLIRLDDDQHEPVYLLTNLLKTEQLPNATARWLYGLRWGVEVFYRSAKQTLQRRRLLSRTPETCQTEAQWVVAGLWLLGLITVREQLPRGLQPRNWSAAKARDAVRSAMRFSARCRGRQECLSAALVAAVKDDYIRRGSKKARNYPRKKREKPPGPPIVQPATALEQKQAKELQTKISAVTWTA